MLGNATERNPGLGSLPVPGLLLAFILSPALTGCLNSPSISEVQLASGRHPILVRDLHCPASGNMIATGTTDQFNPEGIILYSEDRGAVWRRAALDPPPAGGSLFLVEMPSPGGATLHASGYRGVPRLGLREPYPWWTSQDGGRTWGHARTQPPLDERIFFDFWSQGPNPVVADRAGTLVAAMVGPMGLSLLRSTDGGEHWDKRLLSMPGERTSISVSEVMSDGNGNLAILVLSRTLQLVSLSPVRFARQLYLSSDAGSTWLESVSFPQGHDRIYRSPSGSMLAYGQLHTGWESTFYSNTHGQMWSMAARSREDGLITGIAGNARGRIVAVTAAGLVQLSDDGGASWRYEDQPIRISPAFSFYMSTPVLFVGEEIVIATTVGSKIFRSADQGDTWTVVDTQLPDRDFRLSKLCTDGNGLVMAAGRGVILRSTDWGLTWQRGSME